jgi:hypothetical protein
MITANEAIGILTKYIRISDDGDLSLLLEFAGADNTTATDEAAPGTENGGNLLLNPEE